MDTIALPENAVPRRIDYLIRSDASSITTLEQEGHVSRLSEAFTFSRWLVVTYQAAVIGILLVVAVCRWQESRARRRRRRARKTHKVDEIVGYGTSSGTKGKNVVGTWRSTSSSSSGSASTGAGNCTPSYGHAVRPEEEWTHLLDREGKRGSKRHTRTRRLWLWARSKTMYQPPPIPGIRKVLPPTETSLWILSLFTLNLFYLFFRTPLCAETQTILSDRAGLLFVANLPWLYLVAAKNQPIKHLTGDSYENLNLLHRRLGEWMCFLAAIHLAGMIMAWWTFLRPAGLSLYQFMTIYYIFWGCFAWACYEVLYLMSLGSFRERWYEVFLGSHVLLQAGALLFMFLHHYAARPYVAVSLLVFVLDRFVWRLGLKNCSVRVDLKVMEDQETVLVSADWDVRAKETSSWFRKWVGYDMRFGWLPSEHVFISIPGISRKHGLQFHPMTIASAAPSKSTAGASHAWFNLIIRAKEGFSRDLLHFAQNNSSTLATLDGPYGSMHALEMLQESDVAIVVAGGSGIAVAYPLLWDLLHRQTSPYADDTDNSAQTRQRIALIWIVQDASHLSWIGQERLEELRNLGLYLVIPGSSRAVGRPDVEAILRETVDELTCGLEKDAGVGVVVSGPDGLNRTVQNTCADMVRSGQDVEVAVEKFGW